MAEFEGQVKRDLSKRKFNCKDKRYCGTGGVENGCPFFRLNERRKWVCTLYRTIPKTEKNRYRRVNTCMNDEEPPIKKSYTIHYLLEHTYILAATSEEEARKLFAKSCEKTITGVIEGEVIDYENII